MEDLYIQYDELVESGEIDPNEISCEDWVIDQWSSMIDRAIDRLDMER